MNVRIEVFCAEQNRLGEGPIWDVAEQRLYWVNSLAPAVHSADASGGDRCTWKVPLPVGSMALREAGGAILALSDGFHTLDFDTGETRLVTDVHSGDIHLRLNDGKVDRQGRFVAGGIDRQMEKPLGTLFRVDHDWSTHILDTGTILSNGPCWSPDGSILYFADTAAWRIYRYDYDTATGAVRSRDVFADFKTLGLRGWPDGATVDAEGYIWSVEADCGRLLRFDPEGVLDRILGLPTEAATSVAFGGPDLDIAFITSIGKPLGGVRPREREAGFVFAIHGLGVRGIPEPRFKG